MIPLSVYRKLRAGIGGNMRGWTVTYNGHRLEIPGLGSVGVTDYGTTMLVLSDGHNSARYHVKEVVEHTKSLEFRLNNGAVLLIPEPEKE